MRALPHGVLAAGRRGHRPNPHPHPSPGRRGHRPRRAGVRRLPRRGTLILTLTRTLTLTVTVTATATVTLILTLTLNQESRQREAGQEGGDAEEEESYARLVEAEARDASPGEAREKPGEPRPGEPPREVPLKAAATATAVESAQEEGRQGAREEEGEQRQRLVSLSVGGAVRSAWSWPNGMWNGRRQEG